MKKALTLLMLALSLTAFSQNATKVVILDTYNKGGKLKQSTLVDLKTNLAQTISETYGFEGVIDKKVDSWLLAEGFAEHPRLSEEQVQQVANLSGTPYAIMSEASIDDFGYISMKTILINLDAYQVIVSESTSMNNTADQIHKGCAKLINKLIEYLPKPEMPIVEEKTEATEPVTPVKTLPTPQQLTSREAEEVSRHIIRADVCIENGYIDKAIEEYNKIVEIAPGWANVYMYLGNTYASKGDALSLQKAKENYNVFVQLTDDRDLFYEAQDKLSRIEMMAELKGKEDENTENLVGTWRSTLYDKYTGQPYFIVDIAKTSIPNRYQIILSPKSLMYENIVSTKAYSDVIDGKISWSYTFQQTYIPNQTKYNIDGAIVNYLFGAGSLGSLVGNTIVEIGRANDVGYTNIMDFDFVTNVNIKENEDEYTKDLCDKYMEGSCQMRGEHHQSGRNNVNLDTVQECGFLKGDSYSPVFIKVKEYGGEYYYGDIRDGIRLSKNDPITNYSPYISKKESEVAYKKYKTGSTVSGVFLGISGGLMLGGFLFNEINEVSGVPLSLGKSFFIVNGVVAGASLIGLIASSSQWSNYLEKCYTIHNRKVDENIRKYGRRDQASALVNVGITPAGVGVSLNF